jgi:23S rRNA (adenine-N6)-dimethyltransferase
MNAHHHRPGRHELGQNFLTDQRTIRTIVDLAAATDGPLVEWAAGNGALTQRLALLDRPLEAVEIDSRRIAQLRRRLPPHVCISEGDILRHAPPSGRPCTVICNVPFHITTAVLRRLLRLPDWEEAILITQWEVARKRAAVGGATQLTAQWWPWFTFTLHQRIPAVAFTPRPSVDAGLLSIRRRTRPLVVNQHDYQRWVKTIFNGAGRGLPQILTRAGGIPSSAAGAWCRREGLTARSLPKDLTAEQWASAYTMAKTRTARTQ